MSPHKIKAEPYEFTFDPETTALVIIDMQRDFVEPGGFGEALGNDVSILRTTIAPIKKVLEACRKLGMMIVHTREGHRSDLTDCPPSKLVRGKPKRKIGDGGSMGRLLVRGEAGHDIIPELYPKAGEIVIDKPGKGAFYATDFEAILRNKGHLRETAQRLIRRGIIPQEDGWNGWLGRYQKALSDAAKDLDRERLAKETRRDRNRDLGR